MSLSPERTTLPALAPNPVVTLAISTLDRPESLAGTLDALSAVDLSAVEEILIVDQSEEPCDARAWKDRLQVPLRVIHQRERGLGPSRNQVLREARGDVVLHIDDDVIPDRELVNEHLRVYREHPLAIGVAGRERIAAPERLPAWRAPARRMLTRILIPYFRHSRYRKFLDDRGKPVAIVTSTGLFLCDFNRDRECRVMTPRGCNMSFRRDALLAIGGFDDASVGPRRDESDASLRLLRTFPDHEIWFNPHASLVHLMAPSGGCRETDPRVRVAQALRCEARFAKRNLGPLGRRVATMRIAVLHLPALLRHPTLIRELLFA